VSPDFEAVAAILRRRLGLPPQAARAEEIKASVELAMRQAGVDDVSRFAAALQAGEINIDEMVETVDSLTVRETYFFRHAGQFELLRTSILPELKKVLSRRAQLRLWCAGCATGEEPYSLAIVLAEAGLLDRVHILATDVSRESLARARRAHYGRWSFRETPPEFATRWFHCVEGVHVLDESIRRHVVFEPLNLAGDPYPCLANGTWGLDLILCRNVLLYFDKDTIRRAALHFHDSLREGGWLMTGPSDPSLEHLAPFEVTYTRAGVLYRRRTPFVRAPAHPPRRRRRTTVRRLAVSASVAAPTVGAVDPLISARAAFQAGNWAVAALHAAAAGAALEAKVLEVRALANQGHAAQAETVARQALRTHEQAIELHFLRALLLLTLKREADALECARRAVYLDRGFVIGHFLIGEIQSRLGHRRGARIAYRNALELCKALPPDTLLPLGDGHSAGRLATTAAEQLAGLERQEGAA